LTFTQDGKIFIDLEKFVRFSSKTNSLGPYTLASFWQIMPGIDEIKQMRHVEDDETDKLQNKDFRLRNSTYSNNVHADI